jgi:ABC-type lipoprotein release transport system permease subunit
MQLGSLLLLALVAMLAALLPARRAARTEIVDALGHV